MHQWMDRIAEDRTYLATHNMSSGLRRWLLSCSIVNGGASWFRHTTNGISKCCCSRGSGSETHRKQSSSHMGAYDSRLPTSGVSSMLSDSSMYCGCGGSRPLHSTRLSSYHRNQSLIKRSRNQAIKQSINQSINRSSERRERLVRSELESRRTLGQDDDDSNISDSISSSSIVKNR